MSRPKTVDEAFTQNWNKAVAWAQTQGISASSYIPVYQMDAQRLQNGYTPMSAAERNIGILAAANPNNVPSAPSDNPQPSNVFGNARHDLASIVTGLEPSHLVTGLFDTVKNTATALENPQKEEGANLGTTAANWLQNTLLAFVPGAYDIGTVLRADPNLSGSEGFKALADHPLMSLLDLMPLNPTKALATTAFGETIAKAGGQTAEQMAQHGTISALSKILSSHEMSMGIKPGSAAGGIQAVTVGDRIQTWLQDTRLGSSAPVQHFAREYVLGNQLYTGLDQSMMSPFLDAFHSLSSDEQKEFQALDYAQQRGQNIEALLADPKITEQVREAWKTFDNGPLRFAREEGLVGHGGRDPDNTALRAPDGTIRVYSSTQAPEVFAARDALVAVRQIFKEHYLDPADRLVKGIEATDARMGALADTLDPLNKAAQAAIPRDEKLLENIKVKFQPKEKGFGGREKPEEVVTRGVKRDAATKVFGPSGYVDQFIQAIRNGELDKVESLVPVLKARLSSWDLYSVKAADNPAFAAVADMVGKVSDIVANRQKMNDELDMRIEGEQGRTVRESAEAKVQRAAESRELHQRHVAERKQAREDEKVAVNKINSARQVKLRNLDDLYERMKEAALVKGDQAAERATKEQADAIYQSVKKDIGVLRENWFEAKKASNARYDAQVAETKLKAVRERPKVAKRQDGEIKDLAEHHANGKMFHGQLTQEMRNYNQVLKDFHQAVYDHPSDEYVSAEVDIYMKNLMKHEAGARLIDETDKSLKTKSGWEQSRVDDLHANPQLLREEVWMLARDIYQNPLNYSTDLAAATKQAMDEVRQTGIDELNTLIAQGYRPVWVPRAGTFDRPASAIKATVGKGIPHVDAAMARVHDLTATRHDAVLGVSKAMAQTLRRDATIDMVEHSIVPRTVDGETLKDQIKALLPREEAHRYENLDLTVGTSLDALSAKAAEMGLTRFDPNGLFGFSMPRWEGKALYMPSGLVKALEKMQDLEKKGDTGLFDKTNQVFRYSILGLSPRYTAHILFGGTFLLALRSTPYMPFMIGKAVRDMREGNIPEQVWRQPAQEGFSRMQVALNQHAFTAAEQLPKLLAQEHIETIQKIALSKASPFHYLKALADINFKMTRWMTRVQSAVAYTDYAAKAEREGEFFDEVTGKTVPMTKERAMVEGMNHVQQVFGDLRSMTPLERSIAKNIMPFYGWTRHILKYVLTMPADHPWRAMTLALIAYENSAEVPKGLPERIQFLFFLGSPDSQGNVSAIDTRFMDPLRDVANYASLGGWIQGLNPVFLGPAAMMDPGLVYGSTSLYPNLTYNDMYGIETAGAQGSAVSGLQQFVPQLGALQTAMQSAFDNRTLAKSNPNAFYKSIFESLNIPFAQVQKINVKQIAAKDAQARYLVAEQASKNAFQTGDFSSLKGYATVPNPMNADYEITPAQLEAVYNNALAEYPGQQPINVLLPPPTPAGY